MTYLTGSAHRVRDQADHQHELQSTAAGSLPKLTSTADGETLAAYRRRVLDDLDRADRVLARLPGRRCIRIPLQRLRRRSHSQPPHSCDPAQDRHPPIHACIRTRRPSDDAASHMHRSARVVTAPRRPALDRRATPRTPTNHAKTHANRSTVPGTTGVSELAVTTATRGALCADHDRSWSLYRSGVLRFGRRGDEELRVA
jgi:hypothetical protein